MLEGIQLSKCSFMTLPLCSIQILKPQRPVNRSQSEESEKIPDDHLCMLWHVKIGGVTVKLGGMAKGSGMIHPNMATMLGVRYFNLSVCT